MASQISEAWQRLCCEVVIAKNSHLINADHGARNPILDYLLPSLLHIKMASILDEALTEKIASLKLSRGKHRDDLNGHIDLLAEHGQLIDSKALHGVRGHRNALAHESKGWMDWKTFDSQQAVVQGELEHLKLIGPALPYQFYWEQSEMVASDEPGVLGEQTFTYGVRVGDAWHLKLQHVLRMFADDADT